MLAATTAVRFGSGVVQSHGVDLLFVDETSATSQSDTGCASSEGLADGSCSAACDFAWEADLPSDAEAEVQFFNSASALSNASTSTPISLGSESPTLASDASTCSSPPLPVFWSSKGLTMRTPALPPAVPRPPPAVPPAVAEQAPVVMSRGSVLHAFGSCTPCKFFRGNRGCKAGASCNLCHYGHQEMTYSGIRRLMRKKGLQKGREQQQQQIRQQLQLCRHFGARPGFHEHEAAIGGITSISPVDGGISRPAMVHANTPGRDSIAPPPGLDLYGADQNATALARMTYAASAFRPEVLTVHRT